jgi:prepilin-type N-terminal cleavage/methylation domain-containing protein
MCRRDRSGQSGVTLIELLVVMVVLSVGLAVVVPSTTNSYDNWMLRTAGKRTVAFFRYASDTARKRGVEVAGYYANGRFTLVDQGVVLRQLQIPERIAVQPGKPRGAVFLPTGQILTSEPFVLENDRGRKIVVEVGPLPGQVQSRETMK